MTENECIETLQYLLGYENAVDKGELDTPNNLNSQEKEALRMILEEIQQYRAIGLTPELIEAMQGHNIALINDLGEYQKIGTVKEFEALKEKSVPKKVIAPPCNACDKELCDYDCKYFLTTYRDEYKCPTCHTNQVYIPEYEIRFDCCPNCGQKLDWQ